MEISFWSENYYFRQEIISSSIFDIYYYRAVNVTVLELPTLLGVPVLSNNVKYLQPFGF